MGLKVVIWGLSFGDNNICILIWLFMDVYSVINEVNEDLT